jgi:hypothetical protein
MMKRVWSTRVGGAPLGFSLSKCFVERGVREVGEVGFRVVAGGVCV